MRLSKELPEWARLSIAEVSTVTVWSAEAVSAMKKGARFMREEAPAYFVGAILSQTCQKAFISSGWPSETRAYVSMGGKGRPMRILLFLK